MRIKEMRKRAYLKELRDRMELTQSEVADQLGISQNYYSAIETGERQSKMTIDMALKLAKIFAVTIDVILENENHS